MRVHPDRVLGLRQASILVAPQHIEGLDGMSRLCNFLQQVKKIARRVFRT
jgi:hypothetical protein